MNINPMQLIQLIKGGNNPQQLLMSILRQGGNNPILNNVVNLMQNNDTASLQKVARNLAQQKGLDFDKQFANFKRNL